MHRLALHWKILIAIGLACVAGHLSGKQAAVFGVSFYSLYSFLGTLFLNALKMLIVPLIFSSIVCGVVSLGSGRGLGRLGGRTLLLYMCTSLFSVLVGLMFVNLMVPGVIDGQPAGPHLGLAPVAQTTLDKLSGHSAGDLVAILIRMVPPNIVMAAAHGQMLGLIFFGLLLGSAIARLPHDKSDLLTRCGQGVFEAMMMITHWVMVFAPLGVFGLVAKTIAQTGFAAFMPLLVFFLTVLFALAMHFFVVMPLMLRYLGQVSPLAHYRAMGPALLTAFSTASSSATLPLTLKCVEQRAGVSNRTSSFVLPLGATINMDGTALYECVAAVFIAQAYGIHLSFFQQFTVVTVALVTSIGVAGIPSASLVAISVILEATGLPLEGIGLLFVTDRVLDMCRTAVNVFGDSCVAVIIAKKEGEDTVLTRPVMAL